MKRVQAGAVIEAFKRFKDIQPAKGSFFQKDKKGNCYACGLGILAYSKGAREYKKGSFDELVYKMLVSKADETADVCGNYQDGYSTGWDETDAEIKTARDLLGDLLQLGPDPGYEARIAGIDDGERDRLAIEGRIHSGRGLERIA